jgi:Cu-Zn family superoxide dismutase
MKAIHGSALVSGAILLMFAAGCTPGTPASASAEIRDVSGNAVGRARFEPAGEEDVKVTVEVTDLTPGAHGIHIHEAGRCEPPDFASAGAHFNPGGQSHHGAGSEFHHAGDLPNLIVLPDGTGRIEAVLRGITMLGRGHHSLFHQNGTSILIHHGADDLKSAPSGNSGDRIACGIIAPPAG